MTWLHRKTKTLDDLIVTHHAIDAYMRRVPDVSFTTARDDLLSLAGAATFCGPDPTGAEIWTARTAAGALRLVVHRIARRPPLLLTVLAPGQP